MYFPSCHWVFWLFREELCHYMNLQKYAWWNLVWVGLSILIPPKDNDNVAYKDRWQSDICGIFETRNSILFYIIPGAQVHGVLQPFPWMTWNKNVKCDLTVSMLVLKSGGILVVWDPIVCIFLWAWVSSGVKALCTLWATLVVIAFTARVKVWILLFISTTC